MNREQFEAHALHESRHWWFMARRAILLELTMQTIPASRSTLIVEVGCGTGANVAALAEHYCAVGIDIATDAIDIGRQRFPELQLLCGTAPVDVHPPLSQAKGVWLLDVLEHVEEDLALLTELVDAAAPDCHLFVTVPADMSLWSSHDVALQHYRRYSQQNFQALWESLPVETVLLSPINTRLYWPIRLARSIARIRGKSIGKYGNDLRMPGKLANRLLFKVFASELSSLTRGLTDGSMKRSTRGVSLIAVLRKR